MNSAISWAVAEKSKIIIPENKGFISAKNEPLFDGKTIDYYNEIIQGHVHFKLLTEDEKVKVRTIRALGMAYGNDPIDYASYIIIKEKELFGDILVFTDDPRYLGHGICKTNVKLAYITREDFIKLCKDEQFLSHYLHIICNKSLALRKQNKLLCHKNIRDRILFYLSMKQKDLYHNQYLEQPLTHNCY